GDSSSGKLVHGRSPPSRTKQSGPTMSRKVVAVAAGEAHTLALTADGIVFSWGRGTFGRLGTGKDVDELFPVPIASCGASSQRKKGGLKAPQPNFVGIAAGAYHSLALRGSHRSISLLFFQF
ncbi:unnamed protein product, partial [Musa hybrid cultivar]